ncbi:Mpp10 protein-domain-containing protein [Lipomyces kononenkoae]|uniref:Mpp10 protein-domain-containing protein n=1 Tax=Lipomyces kononenkoae TaxID=34357 RepID=A0ACC3T1J1_LIPKO
MAASQPEFTSLLRETLSTAPEQLLLPTPELLDSARHSVKYFLDPIAKHYSTLFKEGIYLNGLDSLQVWEQTRLVLDGVADKVLYDKYASVVSGPERGDDSLETIAKRRKLIGADDDDDDGDNSAEDAEVEKNVHTSDESDEELFGETDDAEDGGQDSNNGEDNMEDEEEEEDEVRNNLVDDIASEDEESDVQNDVIDDIAEDDGEDGIEEEGSDLGKDLEDGNYDDIGSNEEEDRSEEDHQADDFVKDVHGLNSRFFNIDDFNRITEEAEQSNFPDDDDEDIDYFADPDELSGSLEKPKPREVEDNESFDDSDDYDEDDIEGHFGGVTSQNDHDNTNDIRYEDFFAPPPRRRQKKSNKNGQPQHDFEGLGDEFDDENLELAMGGLKKDLFAEDGNDRDESVTEDDQGLSTFEKMQRKLNAQIAELEEENLAKKDWALMGEAKARDRPLNSLLEEDLEFDRGTKPVPVITKEVTESLEEMIRNRIKNNDFNDVARRNPDGIAEFRPSKLVDVDQTKSSKSLAEIYEEEHMREIDPDSHPTVEDSKLKQAHQEIEELFADITYKLDALSSWHFTPKPAKPSISIVTNAPAITMEDAQPVALSTENMLAPQEVYVPLGGIAKDDKKKEVIGGDGLPVARAEMSREERKRRRRQLKTRYAKQEAKRLEARKVKGQTDGSRASVVETLKKGNVTVIGKRGEKRDIEGRLKVDKAGLKGSSQLKL